MCLFDQLQIYIGWFGFERVIIFAVMFGLINKKKALEFSCVIKRISEASHHFGHVSFPSCKLLRCGHNVDELLLHLLQYILTNPPLKNNVT